MKYKHTEKKNYAGFIAVLAVMVLLMSACIIDNDKGEYDYTGIGNDYGITRYRGKGGNVIIPETIDGHTINAISDSAFANNSSITGVTIAKTITTIGNKAFSNCANLASVTIEYTGSYVTIMSETFDNCPNLISVTIKGTASLLEDSFLGNLYNLRKTDDGSNLLQPGTYTTTAPVNNSSTWQKTP